MSTQQPRALALPSSPAFRALHSRGHRPLCLHHLEPHRQRCTFCIDADTEHTHHTHTGPTGPPTDTVPGSVPGLASEPPSTDTKKSLSKVLPDTPKERTFNTVGKAGRAPARAGTEGGGWPHSPRPEAPGLGPGQPFTSIFSSSRDSVDYGPSTDHIHRNTRHKTQ